ncbi:homoserine O-succinyltransferase [Paucilactobacillus hokkaidonensis JCM 18461]|uniref:Homoserine O-acetyltransferase n=2 Tax=Paucilactobacillus hokkaidonensis TaxID=1193095 RepID=A0A0A1GYB2_9LACO|nr:homoserine O-succinyltransferase [Paucilactobacillus hokkaidonensis]BAP85938.1 homoserine O-succinyltransferase [Paucilactobacillus hokkaidonensis JCM 18461]
MTKLKQRYSKQFILNRSSISSAKTLNLLVLNIMPNKLETEGQILNLCTNYSQNLSFTFLYPQTHHFKTNIVPYLEKTYATLEEVKDEYFDGLIVTGAPVENLDFTQVDYWNEFTQLLNWSKTHVKQRLFICWAAQAALNYDFGIPKYQVEQKIFGVFKHHIKQANPLLHGLKDVFYLPHSRRTTIQSSDVTRHDDLNIILDSSSTGPQLITTVDRRDTFITGHPEYNTNTLADEYFRDRKNEIPINLPENYFYANDPSKQVINRWHDAGIRLFTNWLNQVETL